MYIVFIYLYNIILLSYKAIKRATFSVILAILARASGIRAPTGASLPTDYISGIIVREVRGQSLLAENR
jgi:hypothetical protein